jgi:predicted DNA binding CopG/RHH family protein
MIEPELALSGACSLSFSRNRTWTLFETLVCGKQLHLRENYMKDKIDASKLKRRPGKVKVDSGAAKVMISLRMDASVIGHLKVEALRLGMPYQTLLSSVLYRYVKGELIDKAEVKKIVS